MSKKVIVGSIAGGLTGFLLGGLLWGWLLTDFYKSNTTSYLGLMLDPPKVVGLVVGNFFWSILMACLLYKMDVREIKQGACWGGFTFLMVMAGIDIFYWATLNLYTPQLLVIDVLINTAFGAAIGVVTTFSMNKVS